MSAFIKPLGFKIYSKDIPTFNFSPGKQNNNVDIICEFIFREN